MNEANILRATLLRGVRQATRCERMGVKNPYGLGSRRNYQRALLRFRMMRHHGLLDHFWHNDMALDMPLQFD